MRLCAEDGVCRAIHGRCVSDDSGAYGFTVGRGQHRILFETLWISIRGHHRILFETCFRCCQVVGKAVVLRIRKLFETDGATSGPMERRN